MSFDSVRGFVTRRPGRVTLIWLALAFAVGLTSPNLTRLAAEGQAHLLSGDLESARGAAMIRQAWPEQWYESTAVVALSRPTGLNDLDRAYAAKLAAAFDASGRPSEILRVFGPNSNPKIAERLVSADKTMQLIVVPFNASFVAPSADAAVDWLQAQAASPTMSALAPPGLQTRWTGDAVVGRDYMANVQTSLDRAALVTVVLLLLVLLAVYRSFLLALVPLATIGVSLVLARGALAWMATAGWEISPLVELFLIVILFGSGTDFCLFVSWRYGENWNPANPGSAMRLTLRRSMEALLTSAGTVIIGLLLMGTTKFKLFSSTGPSVAIGLAISVTATLTLTPALLVLLAKWRPQEFSGLSKTSSGFWDAVARRTLARPFLSWAATLLVMVPIAVIGLRDDFLQDLPSEMPPSTSSVVGLREVSAAMGPGAVAPLTIVLESDKDLRKSPGLALIDDISRLLAHQRRLKEVRSATQPLGSTELLDRARILARLGEVNDGFQRLETGAEQLHDGLDQGLTKLKAAMWLERVTGVQLVKSATPAAPRDPEATRAAISSGFKQAASVALFGQKLPALPSSPAGGPSHATPSAMGKVAPRELGTDRKNADEPLVRDLTKAVDGASQIAGGLKRATAALSEILNDPVGRRALDRLLVTAETLREHPELLESFAAYITPDGKHARIDVAQSARVFSSESLDQVETIRRRLRDHLVEEEGMKVNVLVTGTNAAAADTRALTRSDQLQSWFVVPIGVFLVLWLALRDPLSCLNLVATMVLTYGFALGVTHTLFVTFLGAEGLDWKVPYFLFVLLVAVGVDYNVFLMSRLREETGLLGLRAGIGRAVGQTGGLITSAAAITAVSFASFLFSPLSSLRQLGFALVVGIGVDALLVRPLLVPCGHWLLNRRKETRRMTSLLSPNVGTLAHVPD